MRSCSRRRSASVTCSAHYNGRRAFGGATLIAAVVVAPLAIAVANTPHFFWRDANIATFGHGYTLRASEIFVQNYVTHLGIGPLFATGDGILDHGPTYGVLYWWMLPFMLIGIATAWRSAGRSTATFLYCWLAIYPLGGALTNDGIPDFPRTMIGAPLACIFAALGLREAWLALGTRAWGRVRLRRAATVAFALVAAVSTLDFVRAYLYVYPDASAGAFKFGTADLFATLRARDRDDARVCFASLDWYNYPTLTDYYLAGSHLVPFEGIVPACREPGSLVVVDDPAKSIPGAHLLATQRNRDGSIMAYIFES